MSMQKDRCPIALNGQDDIIGLAARCTAGIWPAATHHVHSGIGQKKLPETSRIGKISLDNAQAVQAAANSEAVAPLDETSFSYRGKP